MFYFIGQTDRHVALNETIYGRMEKTLSQSGVRMGIYIVSNSVRQQLHWELKAIG